MIPITSRFLIIIFIFTGLSIHSQSKYNLSQFGNETGELIRQPLDWQTIDFVKLGAVLGATYGLMHIDESIRDIMLEDTSWRGSVPLEFGRYWGEPATSLLLGSGLLIIGANHDNKSHQKLGFEILQSFAYSVVVNGSLKIILGRARPSTGADAFTFKPAQSLQNDYWSLPSGHTTIAFSLSTVLAENTESTVWKIISYAPAFITALSRVNYNRHWVSDVFLGGLSGYFIAKFVTEMHNADSRTKSVNLNQTPLISLRLQF